MVKFFFVFFFHELHQSVRVSSLILLNDLDLFEKLVVQQLFRTVSLRWIFFKHFPQQIFHFRSKLWIVLEIKVDFTLSVFPDHFSFVSAFKKSLSGQSILEINFTVCKRSPPMKRYRKDYCMEDLAFRLPLSSIFLGLRIPESHILCTKIERCLIVQLNPSQ